MRVLVTGRDGQVARSLAERPPQGAELLFMGRPELDLSDPATIARAVEQAAPDVIVNAAAYTAVDRAEDEPDLALAVNGAAPGILAAAAARRGARLVQLSTDYVFDGMLSRPYREDDPVGPAGVYGRTKLAGEEAVRTSGADHVILRTSWVYSPFGTNFVRTMLRLASDRDRISVVEDQRGCPTSALDIADAIGAVISGWTPGTYHFAGQGETVWADFAREIFRQSEARRGQSVEVEGIASAAYPTRAVRPANSRLDSGLFASRFGYRAPPWTESLALVLDRLLP